MRRPKPLLPMAPPTCAAEGAGAAADAATRIGGALGGSWPSSSEAECDAFDAVLHGPCAVAEDGREARTVLPAGGAGNSGIGASSRGLIASTSPSLAERNE